jgi:hypothetical protein
VTQIRSYRRVFDLERRIYSVDRMRLNPAGVPLRGVVYLLGAIACAISIARLPVLGAAVRTLPWFVRDVFIPAALAAALTLIRVDGRAFHHVARSLAVYLISPRRTVALRKRSAVGDKWHPEDLLLLPDGSDSAVRGFRYDGPGEVTVLVRHRTERVTRIDALRGRMPAVGKRVRGSSCFRLGAQAEARRLARGRVVPVQAGGRLLFAVTHRDESR